MRRLIRTPGVSRWSATLLVGVTGGALLLGSGATGLAAAAEGQTAPAQSQPQPDTQSQSQAKAKAKSQSAAPGRDAAIDRQIAEASIEELQSGDLAGREVVQGELAPAAQLAMGITQVAPARVGGQGIVQVELQRRAETGAVLRGVRVRVPAPAGSVITQANGTGWKCATGKAAAQCRLTRKLSADLSPQAIILVLGVKGSVKGDTTVPVRAMATWRGGGTTTTKKDPWQVTDKGSLFARPGLRVSLTSAHGPDVPLLTNSKARHRQFALMARVRNVDGAQVTGTWRQVSGPKATMLQPAVVSNVQDRASQVVQVADDHRKASGTYRFAFRASDAGDSVRRVVSVDVEAAKRDTTIEARHRTLHELARKTRTGNQEWTQGKRQAAHPVHPLVIKGPAEAAAGQLVRYSADVPGAVTSIRWWVDGRPALTGRGESFSVTAPQVRTTMVVRAEAVMGDGRVLHATRLLTSHVSADQVAAAAEVRASSSEVRAADLTPGEKSAFCKVVSGRDKDGSLTTLNGFELRWKANALKLSNLSDPGVCRGDGTEVLQFRQSPDVSIYYNDVQLFTNLTGQISVDGLALTRAKWFLPAKFRKTPGLKKTESFDLFASDGPTQPHAGLLETSPSGWGQLEGFFVKESINIDDAVIFLPLPTGWKAFGTTVSFLPAVPEDLQGSRPIPPGTVEYAQNFRDLLPEGCNNPDPNAVLPQCGSAKMSVRLVANQSSAATFAISNINIGQTSAGSSITASGEGVIDLDGKDSRLKLGIACGAAQTNATGCELVKNLFLKDAWIELSTMGQIRMYAAAEVPGNDPAKPYGFALQGRYRAADNWRLDVKNTTPWQLGAGIELTELTGTVERRVEPGLETKAQLVAGIEAKVTNIPVGDSLKVNEIGGTITNACVDRENLQEALDCNPGELRVAFNLDVTAQLPGGTSPRMTMEGAYNFATKRYRFQGGVADVAIGPEQFQVTEAKFSISNDGSSVCQSGTVGAVDPNQDKFTLGLTAKGNVMDRVVSFTGSTNKDGLCLAANETKPSSLGDGMKVSDNTFAYTSYEDGATVRLPSRETIYVSANQVKLAGQFVVPDSVRDWLGAPEGRITYAASGDTSLKKLAFDIAYQITKPVPIYTKSENGQVKTRLELTKVGLQLTWQRSPMQGDLSLYASSNLFVAGAGGTPDSTTPISLAASLGFENAQLTVGLRAGVETNGATKPIPNAFGVKDLTVRNLAIAAKISIPSMTPAISFDADVTLPGSWGPGAGLKDGIPVRLGFSLGDAAPCITFEAGRESTPDNPAPVIVDIANAGLLTTRHVKFLFAPMGCTLPSGISGTVEVPRGFAIAFDGKIIGSDVKVGLSMGYANNGLQFKGDLEAYLDLKVVSLKSYDGTGPAKVHIDIDTTPNNFKFIAQADAGIEIGNPDYFGARIGIKGNFNYTPNDDFITAKFVGDGKLTVGPIGSTIDMSLDMKTAKPQSDQTKYEELAKQNYANAHAKIRTQIIGLVLEAEGDLQYEAGQMINLHIAAGVEVNLLIAAVKGTLAFDYCLGTLTEIRADGNGSKCQPYDKDRRKDAKPSWRVGLTGYYRVLWWKKDYTWTIYESLGSDGRLEDGADEASTLNLASNIASTSPLTLSLGRVATQNDSLVSLGEIDARASVVPLSGNPTPAVGWKVVGGYGFKYRDNQGEQTAKACQQIQMGTQAWNPRPGNANPPPVEADSVSGNEYCGMLVDRNTTSGPQVSGLWSDDGKQFCLDADGGKTANGTKVQIMDCNKSDAQKFTWEGDSLRSNGKCLDAEWSGNTAGTKVRLWDCNGSDAQKVTYDAAQQALKLQGLCLDVADGKRSSGTQVQLWYCNGSAAQQWAGDTKRERVVCIKLGCFLPDSGTGGTAYIGGRVNTQQAMDTRNQLLAGLRTPPGAIPASTTLGNPFWSADRQMVVIPSTNDVAVWRCKAKQQECLATSRTVALNPEQPYGGVQQEFTARFEKLYQVFSNYTCPAGQTKAWQITQWGVFYTTCDQTLAEAGYLKKGGGYDPKRPQEAQSQKPASLEWPVLFRLTTKAFELWEGRFDKNGNPDPNGEPKKTYSWESVLR